MSGFILVALTPFYLWLFRPELVSLAADCIAEGMRRAKASPDDVGVGR